MGSYIYIFAFSNGCVVIILVVAMIMFLRGFTPHGISVFTFYIFPSFLKGNLLGRFIKMVLIS